MIDHLENAQRRDRLTRPSQAGRAAAGSLLLAILGTALAAPTPAQAAPGDGPQAAAASWRGRVLAPDGAPLRDVAIAIGERAAITTSATLRQPAVTTGADGRFEVAMPQPADRPAAGAAGDGPAELWLHAAQRDRAAILRRITYATPELEDIVLPRGSRLFGRVRDATGAPLAGVRVVATDLLETATRLRAGRRHGFFCAATSTAGGIFDLPAALPGGVRLEVFKPGYERVYREPVAIGAPLEIELATTGWIAGRVLEADGSSVADATVTAGYELRAASDSVRTGPDGSFRIPLERDCRWRLVARHQEPGSAPREIRSPVRRGTAANLELLLPPAEAAAAPVVRVRAVDGSDGSAIAEFTAVCTWQPYAVSHVGYREMIFRELLATTPPTADGQAEVPGPTSAKYDQGVLRVTAPGRAPATVTDVAPPPAADSEAASPAEGVTEDGDAADGGAAEQEPIVVELYPEATVQGIARVAGSGKPVVGAKVLARFDPPGNRQTYPNRAAPDAVQTGADGTFALTGLGEGRWRLEIRHPAHPDAEPRHVELDRAEQRTGVELELPAGAVVAGRLTGIETGSAARVFLAPVPRVAFHPTGSRFLSTPRSGAAERREVRLDEDGAFRFDGVALGNHELVLRLPSEPRLGEDLYLPIEPFRVRPTGIEREFDCSADRPGRLRGQITFTRATTPFEQLLVIAEPATSIRPPAPNYNTRFQGPRSFVARDGSFDVRVSPGQYWLHVVDFRTGVTLFCSAERIGIDTAGTHSDDVALDLTRIDLTRENAPGVDEAAVIERVEVRFAPATDAASNQPQLGNRQYDSGGGIYWPQDSATLTLALPPGQAVFYARSALRDIRVDRQRFALAPLGEAELEIAADQDRQSCELLLSGPAEIPPAPGLAGGAEAGDADDAGIPAKGRR